MKKELAIAGAVLILSMAAKSYAHDYYYQKTDKNGTVCFTDNPIMPDQDVRGTVDKNGITAAGKRSLGSKILTKEEKLIHATEAPGSAEITDFKRKTEEKIEEIKKEESKKEQEIKKKLQKTEKDAKFTKSLVREAQTNTSIQPIMPHWVSPNGFLY